MRDGAVLTVSRSNTLAWPSIRNRSSARPFGEGSGPYPTRISALAEMVAGRQPVSR